MSARPLSVVMVSAGFWPRVGGAESQALELSKALLARGVKVTVLTRRLGDAPERELVQGVRVRRLPVCGTGAADSLSFLVSALGWLLKHGAEHDVFHAHLAGSPALAAAAAGRWLGKPVFVKLGGGKGIGELAASSRTALGRAKLRALACLAPRFLAVAAELEEAARELLGAVPLERLPNGVDAERFKPADAKARAAARAALGLPADAFVLLYTGRFSPEKRLPWFAELFARAAKAAKRDALFVLAGEGPERRLLPDGVRVLPPVPDTAPLYAAADAFALPSTSEGLSNALLEAMSSGLAVVASAVGGTAEAVESERSGLLFAADDENGAEKALKRLLTEPRLATALGAEARKTVESRYAMSAIAARVEGLYRAALDAP